MLSEGDLSRRGFGRVETYQSPFERLQDKGAYLLDYEGSVEGTVLQLESGLQNPSERQSAKYVALHPPRLIRAVLDWKIGKGTQSPGLIEKSLGVGLASYSGDPTAPSELRSFGEEILAQEGFWESRLRQTADRATWRATRPDLSKKSAETLAEDLKGEDILLIALGHGGTAAGIDVFLMYRSLSGSTNSAIYVVRFSGSKKDDHAPRLSADEPALLSRMSSDRHIVIFDEDSSSGWTMKRAISYFRDFVFAKREVVGRVNSGGPANFG